MSCTGNIVYQLSAILWAAFLLFALRPWPFSEYPNIRTLPAVIFLVIVLGIAIADGFVIYKVKRE